MPLLALHQCDPNLYSAKDNRPDKQKAIDEDHLKFQVITAPPHKHEIETCVLKIIYCCWARSVATVKNHGGVWLNNGARCSMCCYSLGLPTVIRDEQRYATFSIANRRP